MTLSGDDGRRFLHIGGLVAMGFDQSGRFLLTVSHSGRGLFDTQTWERVARDSRTMYPKNGAVEGIGPLLGESVKVKEVNCRTETLTVVTPDARYRLTYKEGAVELIRFAIE